MCSVESVGLTNGDEILIQPTMVPPLGVLKVNGGSWLTSVSRRKAEVLAWIAQDVRTIVASEIQCRLSENSSTARMIDYCPDERKITCWTDMDKHNCGAINIWYPSTKVTSTCHPLNQTISCGHVVRQQRISNPSSLTSGWSDISIRGIGGATWVQIVSKWRFNWSHDDIK